ncbi:MAG: helix-turn-helix domain-containing protein [Cyclobacteriaceae bacterium]
MENDFLTEIGYPGLTGRLKRLNDLFVYQTREFYKRHNVDIEPNWHMLFLLLQKHEKLTVTEIADALHLSHPAIVKLVDKMKKNGYLVSVRDESDKRKFYLELSEKAKNKLPELEKYWDAGIMALRELMENSTELLKQLKVVEKNIFEEDFRERSERILKE